MPSYWLSHVSFPVGDGAIGPLREMSHVLRRPTFPLLIIVADAAADFGQHVNLPFVQGLVHIYDRHCVSGTSHLVVRLLREHTLKALRRLRSDVQPLFSRCIRNNTAGR